jgi:hypothetical protein
MEKARLATDAGHDDRLAGLDDFAGNPLAEPIANLTARRNRSGRRFELHVAGLLVEQHDGAAHGPVMPAEDFEHALQRGAQIERRGKRLTRFEKRRQLANFARVFFRRLHPAGHRIRCHLFRRGLIHPAM